MKITAGVVSLLCRLSPEDTETNGFEILSLAIDGEDNVYIFAQCDNVYHWKLFVYNAKGNVKYQSTLNCFDDSVCAICITKDKIIIAHVYRDKQIHVCDSS